MLECGHVVFPSPEFCDGALYQTYNELVKKKVGGSMVMMLEAWVIGFADAVVEGVVGVGDGLGDDAGGVEGLDLGEAVAEGALASGETSEDAWCGLRGSHFF